MKQNEIEKTSDDSSTMELPLDYENLFLDDSRAKNVHTDSISDGLVLCLSNIGRVDIEYISAITGEAHKTIIESLEGAIYQNPEKWEMCFYKGWELADEYLSGNLRHKLVVAMEANRKYNGVFQKNIEAIQKVMPGAISSEDIYITIGSPWVPPHIYDDFIEYMLGLSHMSRKDYAKVKYDSYTGTWEIPYKNRYYRNARSYSAYGTNRIEALYILEKTLNMQSVVIYDTSTYLDKTIRTINKAETSLAIEKQKHMIEVFQNWVWTDSRRKAELLVAFENKYSSYVRRRFDGSFLPFPNLDPSVHLYNYQKNAIARILFNQNTLLAHDVGSGKTYVMIAAGMELLRMGLSKKNLYVVPNNIITQWREMFNKMYPNAHLLIIEPKDFTPKKRYSVMYDIMSGRYDSIIMAYSCFDMIPLSREYYVEDLKERRRIIEERLRHKENQTSRLLRERDRITDEIIKIFGKDEIGWPITFDQLGITRLFVDEAHNYKNVPISTQIERALGISISGSKKCKDMLNKVHFVQKNGGVIMATGTPITNSITDAYVMQLYLQSGELSLLDLASFDSWVGMFAERNTEFEVDVDTSTYRLATRFSKFHNLSQLTAILAQVADFHTTKVSDELPEFKGYVDCLVPKSEGLDLYLKEISKRADTVRRGQVSRAKDNMLLITTDGRKAALDLRLVDDTALFDSRSKVYKCALNVVRIYEETEKEKSAQLIFCDSSTPKETFNIYDEMARILVLLGIERNEIAFIHDATTDKQREELYKKTREGSIRVLIGSTFKLGLGVNVQERLIALHHLDIPWRPADMVQREGRIIRPGNTNKEVYIYRYITEGSFDAYSWQLLETKQSFISALLSGSLEDKDSSDIQDTVLKYGEVKALAVGNPLVKERIETYNYLARLSQLQEKTVESKVNLSYELSIIPKEISSQEERIRQCEMDIDFYNQEKGKVTPEMEEKDKENRVVLSENIFMSLLDYVLKDEEMFFGEYRGFKVIFPDNMLIEKPFVYLENEGRYRVDIGESKKGVFIRLNNCLEGLSSRKEKYVEKLQELYSRKKYVEEELSRDVDYSEEISAVKKRLVDIDKKLGVYDE